MSTKPGYLAEICVRFAFLVVWGFAQICACAKGKFRILVIAVAQTMHEAFMIFLVSGNSEVSHEASRTTAEADPPERSLG